MPKAAGRRPRAALLENWHRAARAEAQAQKKARSFRTGPDIKQGQGVSLLRSGKSPLWSDVNRVYFDSPSNLIQSRCGTAFNASDHCASHFSTRLRAPSCINSFGIIIPSLFQIEGGTACAVPPIGITLHQAEYLAPCTHPSALLQT